MGRLAFIPAAIGGGAGILFLLGSDKLVPYLLYFAAGAMIYVVVEELIPEVSQGEHSDISTIGFSVGFIIMMILEVALS